jgi:hypothetical protein
MTSTSLIWFLLVDAATAEPYKRTTADAVSLPADNYIVHFRDAVKAKLTNLVSSVDAAQLLVYENKTTFQQRNDPQNKTEALEEDSLVFGLGKTKKEALIVVVPREDSNLI